MNSGDMTIRAATAADEMALDALAGRLANFDLPAWRTAGEVGGADARAMIAALRAGVRDDEVFVAERTGTVAGCLHILAAADFFERRHAHISVIAVSEAAEGSGVGRALMLFAEGWARERGLSLLTLNVFAGNTRARAFYERGGFQPEILKYTKTLNTADKA